MDCPVQFDSTLGSILLNWSDSCAKDRIMVKKLLMPKDDPNYLNFIVNKHPQGRYESCIYRKWIEIEVFNSEKWLCDIYIKENKIPTYRYTVDMLY